MERFRVKGEVVASHFRHMYRWDEGFFSYIPSDLADDSLRL